LKKPASVRAFSQFVAIALNAIKVEHQCFMLQRGLAFLFRQDVWPSVAKHLDLRSWWACRSTCRWLHSYFSVDRFFARVKLPVSPQWPRERVFTELAWFFALPGFTDRGERAPFFRHRAAMERMVQGALRKLHMERCADGDYLVATIQPSVQWSDTHTVRFLVEREGLVLQGCHCRNG
jgi:hypothetical protein